ncbi:MAG: DNA mismatch repair protein MutS [Clostridia bacterium]|nr:DNA mismatch repair protein MutS [Clostridia bacterium]
MAELSPMMQQYMQIKAQYDDSILMFRLGDFYEMFFDDAKTASRELDLVLTGRDCGQEERAPMCGVPFHSCESYIARLVSRGYKVAICEQTEDPKQAKGIVRREVTSVLTPGTVIDDVMLDASSDNFLAAVSKIGNSIGLCLVDASTGKLNLTEFSQDIEQRLIGEIGRFSPKEIICGKMLKEMPQLSNFLDNKLECRVDTGFDDTTDPAEDYAAVAAHFGEEKIVSCGLISNTPAVAALAKAMRYLYEMRKGGLDNVNRINFYYSDKYMRLDYTAMRNLELCSTMRTGSKKGSLISVIDKTKTSMGKRLLKSFVEQPLIEVAEITQRLNAVEELCEKNIMRKESAVILDEIYDIERICSRIAYGTTGAKELRALCNTLKKLPALKDLLAESKTKLISGIHSDIDPLYELAALLDIAIDDDPPAVIRNGGIIKDGYNAELDELRSFLKNGKNILAELEQREKDKTGIKNLKVRYNKVFGYFIEVSNSYKEMVPEDYIRKQTLTNCERYITEELKIIEGKVLGAGERVLQIELSLFEELRNAAWQKLAELQRNSRAIALLDAMQSLAEVAEENSYCRPKLNTEGRLQIVGGRHPVVEKLIKIPFVPNDTLLDCDDNCCAVITGPNMAGKSTYMRQTALITLLAQIGSFVPAQSADIGIVDAIYTRVGASDDLAAGQSTFMVEMSEVAYIIKNATRRSLIILDEIGRGTSTFDGMSIARAVLEYVANKSKLGAKTMFATHYHELTALEGQLKGIKNYNIAVKKRGDDITFLRRIVRGGADDSYGIDVAKLAGVPSSITNRAREILSQLESGEMECAAPARPMNEMSQISLELNGAAELLAELKAVDANVLTPIECMNILADLCQKAKEI